MIKYRIVSSKVAEEQIKQAKKYIKTKYDNQQAVNNLSKDIKETKEKLKYCAGGMNDYDKRKGTKSIHLKHRYKFVYSIIGEIVLIEEFIHDLQDQRY